MAEYEFTLVATTKIVVEAEGGFEALDKARAAMTGKSLKLRDWDDEDYPHQTSLESFDMKVENIIVGELAPYFDSEN